MPAPLPEVKKEKPRYRIDSGVSFVLAERVGFEPTVVLPLRLISSQVHSTTLPPLLCVEAAILAAVWAFFMQPTHLVHPYTGAKPPEL